MNFYFAHNGIDDGHPDETTSPSVGMPPAPQFTQVVNRSDANSFKNNGTPAVLSIIPALAIGLVLLLIVLRAVAKK